MREWDVACGQILSWKKDKDISAVDLEAIPGARIYDRALPSFTSQLGVTDGLSLQTVSILHETYLKESFGIKTILAICRLDTNSCGKIHALLVDVMQVRFV
jgi:hypothetical protein